MEHDLTLRALPQPTAERPQAGFTEAELQAAARVIENEVQRVSARYALEHAQRPVMGTLMAMRKSDGVSP